MFLKFVACENWNPFCFVFVIALLLIYLMLGISPLRHSSIFLLLEAECLISLTIWLCEWSQSLTCSAWFIDLFSWNQWQPAQWVQLTAWGPRCLTVVVLPGVQAEGFKWCAIASALHTWHHTLWKSSCLPAKLVTGRI